MGGKHLDKWNELKDMLGESFTYRSLVSIFTSTKQTIILKKNQFVYRIWNYRNFHHLLKYLHMNSEIIQNVAYDNYDNFQHVNFLFSRKFISLFWRLFNDKSDLKLRYFIIWLMPDLCCGLWKTLMHLLKTLYVKVYLDPPSIHKDLLQIFSVIGGHVTLPSIIFSLLFQGILESKMLVEPSFFPMRPAMCSVTKEQKLEQVFRFCKSLDGRI
jgi:hypothetical protein